MNRHERRAQKAREKAGAVKPAQDAHGGAQALALLHAAVLRNALDGRFLEALSGCREALALDPDNADSLHLMALVHLEARQNEHALEWVSRAIAKEAKPAFLTTFALALSNLGRHDDALKVFDHALQLKSDDAQLWWQKGNVLLTALRPAEALACFEQTMRLDPRHADAAYKSGQLLHAQKRFEEALTALDRSAALQRDHVATLHLRAVVLKELNRLDEALAGNLRTLELDPGNAEIMGNIGVVLQLQGRFADALTWYDRALQIEPGSARHIMNRGTTLAELGYREEAIATYRQAIAADPTFAEARWNLALLRIQMGDFETGWKGRELRWQIPALAPPAYPKFAGPMWLGEQSLAGKTILVCADEGLGDTINFARYLPLLAQRAARVILVVEPVLCPLLSGVEGVATCLPKLSDTVLPAFDFHTPINGLPLAFGTRLDSIPSPAYLPAPAADRVQAWDRRLGAHDRMRVGLVWSGNPKTSNDRNRSMAFRTMSRLLDVDANFVSLQKDPKPQDAALLAETAVLDLTAGLTDFAETAALLSCLDLVIAVDTSTAHLAATLGKPAWLLLPYMSDYRWMFDREGSPWYPTVRLFRQSPARDFGAVVDRVRAELMMAADEFGRSNS